MTAAGCVEARLPDEEGLVTVALWLEDADRRVRARNYVNVDVHDDAGVPAVEKTPRGYALRFNPGDFSRSS